MTHSLKMFLAAGLVTCGFAGTASALPMASAPVAGPSAHIEDARLICPPYRPCYRVFGGYRGYGYGYGYRRPYRYGYGYHRPYGFYRGYGY